MCWECGSVWGRKSVVLYRTDIRSEAEAEKTRGYYPSWLSTAGCASPPAAQVFAICG
jgi:hypothetical protein